MGFFNYEYINELALKNIFQSKKKGEKLPIGFEKKEFVKNLVIDDDGLQKLTTSAKAKALRVLSIVENNPGKRLEKKYLTLLGQMAFFAQDDKKENRRTKINTLINLAKTKKQRSGILERMSVILTNTNQSHVFYIVLMTMLSTAAALVYRNRKFIFDAMYRIFDITKLFFSSQYKKLKDAVYQKQIQTEIEIKRLMSEIADLKLNMTKEQIVVKENSLENEKLNKVIVELNQEIDNMKKLNDEYINKNTPLSDKLNDTFISEDKLEKLQQELNLTSQKLNEAKILNNQLKSQHIEHQNKIIHFHLILNKSDIKIKELTEKHSENTKQLENKIESNQNLVAAISSGFNETLAKLNESLERKNAEADRMEGIREVKDRLIAETNDLNRLLSERCDEVTTKSSKIIENLQEQNKKLVSENKQYRLQLSPRHHESYQVSEPETESFKAYSETLLAQRSAYSLLELKYSELAKEIELFKLLQDRPLEGSSEAKKRKVFT